MPPFREPSLRHRLERTGLVPRRPHEDTPEPASESCPEFLRREFLRFLQGSFGNNVPLIAYTFEVAHTTAWNWVQGTSLPRAEVLYMMMLGYPAFARRLRLVVDNPEPRPPLARELAPAPRSSSQRVA